MVASGRGGSLSRSYSRMVGLLKYALPAAGLVIVALVVAWPELHHTQVDISNPTERPAAVAGEIQNPRYSGVDEAARPYTVWAMLAKQVQDQIFDLNRPKGEMKLPSGLVLNLDAQSGKLDRSSKSVHLSGNVTLRRSDGTTMVTDAADISLADKGARSSTPVTAEGPFGTLSAGGFKVEQQGDVIIFTGPTKLFLKPGADKAFEGTPQ
ncbi:LPS export ABC transporter periplasmic protein LptC [Mycobacterium sp. KBS0706]|uniref:LPS export ABC transporter periplasmic protein LptC n=1 Tax=Mycobacterium sp. KBS0706 TaxID=2578109 RepID=UPI00110FC686|nr:LPS export ABC transporter periplasmic protein LptC [Mycobacterium sp. KBS0706]TSD89258.1 LPS export ABC transporter periplasmic protein LptC [Mycobacterium sp. KBS0706]